MSVNVLKTLSATMESVKVKLNIDAYNKLLRMIILDFTFLYRNSTYHFNLRHDIKRRHLQNYKRNGIRVDCFVGSDSRT